jgi:hypothetical protein
MAMIGWTKYLVYGLVALGLVAAIVIGVKQCKQIDQENDKVLVNSGVDQERSRGQSEVINHVEQAQDAVRNPTSDELNIVCSKYDRNCGTERK